MGDDFKIWDLNENWKLLLLLLLLLLSFQIGPCQRQDARRTRHETQSGQQNQIFQILKFTFSKTRLQPLHLFHLLPPLRSRRCSVPFRSRAGFFAWPRRRTVVLQPENRLKNNRFCTTARSWSAQNALVFKEVFEEIMVGFSFKYKHFTRSWSRGPAAWPKSMKTHWKINQNPTPDGNQWKI